MFDISENGREAVVSYLKETFGKNKTRKTGPQKDKTDLDRAGSRLQNLILTKSLIIKL